MDAPGWVLIIGAVFGGIVLVFNTWSQWYGRREAKVVADEAKGARQDASDKLDVIHDLTNSNMTALKAQLATALARIEKLEMLLERRSISREAP